MVVKALSSPCSALLACASRVPVVASASKSRRAAPKCYMEVSDTLILCPGRLNSCDGSGFWPQRNLIQRILRRLSEIIQPRPRIRYPGGDKPLERRDDGWVLKHLETENDKIS